MLIRDVRNILQLFGIQPFTEYSIFGFLTNIQLAKYYADIKRYKS
ncbi:unnamed protein product [Larinioides sclopetarius]|uniref:Uncharacterized protein n=1 Tax=Larinioides sclopetarius TaxID=280406 RepID=A0AAV2AYI3_9ARAC